MGKRMNTRMIEKRKQEYSARQEQTKEQYAFTVFLTCPQQTDQMIWWCGEPEIQVGVAQCDY